MKEITYHKLHDGNTLVLGEEKGKWVVSVYSKSDIEISTEEFTNEIAAWAAYVRLKYGGWYEKQPTKTP